MCIVYIASQNGLVLSSTNPFRDAMSQTILNQFDNSIYVLLSCVMAVARMLPNTDSSHVLQDTWSHVEFKFTQHKGTDVYLVKMAEEDFEALEDNQVLVQVTDSPHTPSTSLSSKHEPFGV